MKVSSVSADAVGDLPKAPRPVRLSRIQLLRSLLSRLRVPDAPVLISRARGLVLVGVVPILRERKRVQGDPVLILQARGLVLVSLVPMSPFGRRALHFRVRI